jgi:hypothetical protein
MKDDVLKLSGSLKPFLRPVWNYDGPYQVIFWGRPTRPHYSIDQVRNILSRKTMGYWLPAAGKGRARR